MKKPSERIQELVKIMYIEAKLDMEQAWIQAIIKYLDEQQKDKENLK